MIITDTGAWDYNASDYNEERYLDKSLIDNILPFIKEENILMDFGCGTGYYLNYISELAPELELIGIEPKISKNEKIINHDLSYHFNLNKSGNILCIEVLEHIPVYFETCAIDNIVNHCKNYLFISWARLGQGGAAHINEKNRPDVIKLFENRGFIYLEKESIDAREKSKIGWIKNNFCIFKKIL